MKRTVILDYGHSAATSGKCSPDKSFYEFKFNRELGAILKKLLKKEGFDVVETVIEDDVEISLGERSRRANLFHGENTIFVSIHANASGDGSRWNSARGWSVFVHKDESLGGRRLATKIAEAHQRADFKIRKQYAKTLFWKCDFAVLRPLKMPAVLVENLFYDNIQDLTILKSYEGKLRLAYACLEGIKNFFNEKEI